jgi:hypothetical protein
VSPPRVSYGILGCHLSGTHAIPPRLRRVMVFLPLHSLPAVELPGCALLTCGSRSSGLLVIASTAIPLFINTRLEHRMRYPGCMTECQGVTVRRCNVGGWPDRRSRKSGFPRLVWCKGGKIGWALEENFRAKSLRTKCLSRRVRLYCVASPSRVDNQVKAMGRGHDGCG